jgi:RNA polymerase sigma-70 factor (ECF subfamily)
MVLIVERQLLPYDSYPGGPPGSRLYRFDGLIRPPRRIRTKGDVITDLSSMSDASLAISVARWQETALAELYRRHAGAVYGLARRVLRDATLAEEVTQEVFVRLWREPERFDPARGSLRSLLLAMTHGRAVDLLRAEGSRRAREERARLTATAGYDLEQEVFDITTAERVREAVAALPDGERRAIELAYFGGHTYREVARIVGEPEGTVKSRIRAGMRRLNQALAAFYSSHDATVTAYGGGEL